ncbi:hypothetical protein F0249_03135 [Vibrio sp. 03-59-1]|nr:hypothetical protein [Vibrio sp. 03-59-1]NOH82791.1 hypothetical protein [Vibrio sp. 03-59-1]
MKKNMEQPVEQDDYESHDVELEGEVEQEKLREAYISERTKLEITEIELNRAKIILVDEKGNMKRIPLIPEH